MTNYDSYIDDVIYCNNRSIKTLGTMNPNGGRLGSDQFSFLEASYYADDYNCPNETDKFSLTNPKARLKYPVGLLTTSEIKSLNKGIVTGTVEHYWLMSPQNFDSASGVNIAGFAGTGYSTVSGSLGLRPVISLSPGIVYAYGDDSMEYPYYIDTTS